MNQKMAGAKKVIKTKKISFFMPVNHVKEFWKSVHAVALFSYCFLEASSSYFRVLVSFSKTFFSEKSFQIDNSICGLTDGKIRQP